MVYCNLLKLENEGCAHLRQAFKNGVERDDLAVSYKRTTVPLIEKLFQY